VTVQGAKAYGVVADAAGVIDAAATATLRAALAAERPAEMPLFNYGPSIEALREASLAETGLPGPLQPRWTQALPLAAE
jgi:N-methylhydantoinase B